MLYHRNPQVNAIMLKYRQPDGSVVIPKEVHLEIREILAEDGERRFSSSDPRPVLPELAGDAMEESPK